MNQAFFLQGALLLLVMATVLKVTEAVAVQHSETKVVSISLCADQAVVTLLKKEQIVALSPQARDPKLSAVATQAYSLPVLPATAEAIILSGATTVVGTVWDNPRIFSIAEKLGIQVVRMYTVDKLTAIVDLLQSIATALGTIEQNSSTIIDLRNRLVSILESQLSSPPPVAAYCRPDGGSAGTGTFVDSVLTAAGFLNLAKILGYKGWNRLDLETLVMNKPDVIITTFFGYPTQSLSRRFSRHPVFQALQEHIPVIAVPSTLMTCGTWFLLEAVEFLLQHRKPEPRCTSNKASK